MRRGFILSVAFLSAGLIGCSAHLFSPPARVVPQELSTNPEAGKVEVSAAIGLNGGVFNGTNLSAMQGTFSYGVSDQAAVQAGMTYLHVLNGAEVEHWMGNRIAAFRIGGGYSPKTPRQFIRFTSGLGGGLSAAGGFVSPDMGVNLSWDNRYLVPFVNYSAWVSVPQRGADVTVEYLRDKDFQIDWTAGPTETEWVTETVPVRLTWGHTMSLGIALRLEGHDREVRWNAGEVRRGATLVSAVHVHWVEDMFNAELFFGYGWAIVHRF